ncbi:MAG: acetyl-CoA carboxylase biotin carboxylase subunit [Bacteroidia bacterium]
MKKILISNRGEIALRIIRSAKEMGIGTVAVFSEADRDALHVRYADEAVCIGPAASSASYLLGDKIIETALQFKADGIHPGYGFLSENAAFAQKVQEAGIKFIGPSSSSIEMMGNKLAAKRAAKQYNIPMLPGTNTAVSDLAEAARVAEEIGFPVLIKAAAGGGGKGMRVVNAASEFHEQMQRAVSEAQSSFGDGSVFLEKYISSPRHIEVQVLCDQHGNFLHLFERECSIQRRHQKVVEEAPSCILTPEIRESIGRSAVDVARACHYEGAGTVEFLLDQDLNFYFLEMNTRLQVEHPVTEMVTGVDLVKEQIKIARGEKISFKQEDLWLNGHSIELRIYAEDPYNNFLPDTGTLTGYRPSDGPGVRTDSGYEEGMEIPVFYDPMISKLVTHAPTRIEAIDRMSRAISEFHLEGVANTLPFGKFVMEHEAFRSGNFDTHFVQKHFTPDNLYQENEDEAEVAALLAVYLEQERKHQVKSSYAQRPSDAAWKKRRTAGT